MSDNLPAGPTKLVVGGLIGLALSTAFLYLLDWRWALVAVVVLSYEGWTLINDHKGDTISEVLWVLAARPMVPWLFGVATGWAITSGFIPASVNGVWIALSWGFLQGHFWFQRKRPAREQMKEQPVA